MATFGYPIIALGLIGGLFGIILQYASSVFYVEEDPRVIEVNDALPGANCGACGFPGCAGLANAIVLGDAPVNACPVGGQDTADQVASIMGVDSALVDRKVAVVLCQGDCDKAVNKFDFVGVQDCRVRNLYYDGDKACEHGCLGGGTCFDVCEFDAIRMENGIAIIDKDKCTACNRCIEVCPKNVIDMVPYDALTVIKCNSTDTAREVRSKCSIGCIACRLCVRSCPEETIGFENNLAKIDYSGCIQCGICVQKCPTKCITAEYELPAEVVEAK